MISLRRLVGASVAMAAAVSALAVTAAHADTPDTPITPKAAEPQLCEIDDGIPDTTVTKFPYVMHLDDSNRYPDGPRSCNYNGKHTIVYQCNGDVKAPAPYLNVISNNGGRRSITKTVCDGKRHTLAPNVAYRDRNGELPGPYHLHWHLSDAGGWDSAYLEVS